VYFDINMKVGIVTMWVPRPCGLIVGTNLMDEHTTLSSETQGSV
jgi:hypothetical protein